MDSSKSVNNASDRLPESESSIQDNEYLCPSPPSLEQTVGQAHYGIVNCISEWRRLLNINLTTASKGHLYHNVWLCLIHMHNGIVKTGYIPEIFDKLHKRPIKCLGVVSTCYHRAVSEAVYRMLGALEPNLRPVEWYQPNILDRKPKAEGWIDGYREEAPEWRPFFNPDKPELVNLCSTLNMVRGIRNATSEDSYGFGPVTHVDLDFAWSAVRQEWARINQSFNRRTSSNASDGNGLTPPLTAKMEQSEVDGGIGSAPKKTRSTKTPTIPRLSERQYNILQAMLELGATAFQDRYTTGKIAVKAEGPDALPEQFKHPMSELKKRKLVDSLDGRDGGSWLTDKGRAVAELLKNKGNTKR